MTQFYDILDTLKNELRSSPSVNTVSFGDITNIDLDKTSMFPLSHIIMPSVQYRGNILVFDVNIFFADVVDYNKVTSSFDDFYGSDNLHDIFNTQLQVVNSLVSNLKRGSLFASKYQLEGEPTISPFKEKFSNELAGWDVSFSVSMPNTISISGCSASDAPSGGGGGGGGSDVSAPVILNTSSNNYIQLDVDLSFQILASNTPTSYSVFNIIEGLTVDTATGIISGILTGAERVDSMAVKATNAGGTGEKLLFFNIITEDASIFLAPQNIQASDINKTDFLLTWEFSPYSGTVEKIEIYQNDILNRTLISGSITGFRIQTLIEGSTSDFKVRFINTLDVASPYSDTISVTQTI